METWISDTLVALGYAGVVFLTFIENVFPPIPSELVLPLAGYIASRGEMTMPGVIAAGTLGSVLGALVFHAAGRRLGEARLRVFIKRHGRWLTLSPEDLDRASGWFDRHGAMAVFVCRMIPGLRSVISIPAGIHGMPLPSFLLFTALGTALWTAMLAWAGYLLGANFARVDEYLGPVTWAVLATFVVIYIWRVTRRKGTAKQR